MPIYSLSIAGANRGSESKVAGGARAAAAPVTLTEFERTEISAYLDEWAAHAPDLQGVHAAVAQAIERLEAGARSVSLRTDGPLPDLTPWLIDVKRSDEGPGLRPLCEKQLAHWRAGGADRDLA